MPSSDSQTSGVAGYALDDSYESFDVLDLGSIPDLDLPPTEDLDFDFSEFLNPGSYEKSIVSSTSTLLPESVIPQEIIPQIPPFTIPNSTETWNNPTDGLEPFSSNPSFLLDPSLLNGTTDLLEPYDFYLGNDVSSSMPPIDNELLPFCDQNMLPFPGNDDDLMSFPPENHLEFPPEIDFLFETGINGQQVSIPSLPLPPLARDPFLGYMPPRVSAATGCDWPFGLDPYPDPAVYLDDADTTHPPSTLTEPPCIDPSFLQVEPVSTIQLSSVPITSTINFAIDPALDLFNAKDGEQMMQYPSQRPKRDENRFWVRTNRATTGNTRTGKINTYNPEVVYKQKPNPLQDWSVFKYNRWGELAHRTYSVEEIEKFLYMHPKTDEGKGLKIWIQRGPTDSARRYNTEHSSRCRFHDCVMRRMFKRGTIHPGHYRVAFDERWNLGDNSQTDPFHVAGYVHLYCLERFLNLPDLCRRLDVEVDMRHLPHEPRGQFAASLVNSDEAEEAKCFLEACRGDNFKGEFPGYPTAGHNGNRKAYERTLLYRMNRAKEARRSVSQQRTFINRGLKKSNMTRHLGDLEMFCGAKLREQRRQCKRTYLRLMREEEEKEAEEEELRARGDAIHENMDMDADADMNY